MAKDDWLDSAQLAGLLAHYRVNDVRVKVGSADVPIIGVRYESAGDIIELVLDETSDAYRTAIL